MLREELGYITTSFAVLIVTIFDGGCERSCCCEAFTTPRNRSFYLQGMIDFLNWRIISLLFVFLEARVLRSSMESLLQTPKILLKKSTLL